MLSPGAEAHSLFLDISSGPWLVPTAASARHLGRGSPGLRARSKSGFGGAEGGAHTESDRQRRAAPGAARRREGQPKLSQPHSQ